MAKLMPKHEQSDHADFQQLGIERSIAFCEKWLKCTTNKLKTTKEDAHCVSEPVSARVVKEKGSGGR
jgi:hypothetical protein